MSVSALCALGFVIAFFVFMDATEEETGTTAQRIAKACPKEWSALVVMVITLPMITQVWSLAACHCWLICSGEFQHAFTCLFSNTRLLVLFSNTRYLSIKQKKCH